MSKLKGEDVIIDDKKINVLIHFQNVQYQELFYRRKFEFHIFLWTAIIFIVLSNSILIETTNSLLWKDFGCSGKLLMSGLIFFISFFSIKWQNKEREYSHRTCRVIAKISRALKAFDKNYFIKEDTLFPEKWKYWGNDHLYILSRYFKPNFVTVTWILGMFTILIVWLQP
mgnify:FL=1